MGEEITKNKPTFEPVPIEAIRQAKKGKVGKQKRVSIQCWQSPNMCAEGCAIGGFATAIGPHGTMISTYDDRCNRCRRMQQLLNTPFFDAFFAYVIVSSMLPVPQVEKFVASYVKSMLVMIYKIPIPKSSTMKAFFT